MTKAELGVKRRCLSCNKPFFDLNRAPIVCPSCDAVFQAVEMAHSPPKRTMMSLAYIKKRAAAAPVLADGLVSPAVEESAIPPVEEERIAAIV
ncbi:TIGR02300 family protein [Rhodoblastus sp.]|uniref:TIGR02300 family protein n=1 Tax=Rhodoblastus sp. TaxID=1962975 RepID=UPI003C239003